VVIQEECSINKRTRKKYGHFIVMWILSAIYGEAISVGFSYFVYLAIGMDVVGSGVQVKQPFLQSQRQ